MSAHYDVAVIGGGQAGLTCAALLAKRGRRVVLLEAHDTLGGLAATGQYMPGVRGDTLEHELGWIPAAVYAELDLARHGLALLHADPCATALAPGGETLTLFADPRRTAAALARRSPADAGAWPAFAQRVGELAGFLEALYRVPSPDLFGAGVANLASMLSLGRRARSLGRAGIFDLLRTLPMSVADMLDEVFEDVLLKGLLASRGVARLRQGPRSGATAFLFVHHHVGLPAGTVRGMTTARGGVGALAQILAAAALTHGAVLRTGVAVARIDVREERVRGVTLASGEEIAASTVVSTLDVRHTLYRLLDPLHLEPELSRTVGHVRMRGAVAKVNLVLDGPLPGAPQEILAGPLVIAPSMNAMERAYDETKHGVPAHEPWLELRVPAALDPSLATTDGRLAVSVMAQWVPYQPRGGAWDATMRGAFANRVLQVIERVLPGFAARVVHSEVLLPRDIEQRWGASEGSLTHGELTLDQILFMRPVPALSRYRMDTLHGLFLTGRGSHPGLPVPAALLAAREVARTSRSGTAANTPPAA